MHKSVLSLLGLLALLPFSALRAETLDELYEKAKVEKALVFYTGAGAAAAKATAEAFEKRFPGITVTAKGAFSNVLDREIDQQLKDKKVTTDFVQFQTIQDYRRWDKAGALIHFKPDGFDQVLAPLKDKNGAWVALNAIPMFYGYNPEKVQETDVPKSALDFLKPQFRAKVVTVYPTDDDATLYNFH
jgi:ABC-type Fe3+ transport system substrate-binding protein